MYIVGLIKNFSIFLNSFQLCVKPDRDGSFPSPSGRGLTTQKSVSPSLRESDVYISEAVSCLFNLQGVIEVEFRILN